ncbi:MAG: hypothetical protein N3A38_05605 [Planctomycetota bacterium]|nr:hypothetical protein [Planctomycetota bacterium]
MGMERRAMPVFVAAAMVAGCRAAAVAFLCACGAGAAGEDYGGKPAPVNPYNGMQEREEVFEFTQKPKVEKQGDKWVITFASKGKCDATVAIVGPDGKIVRHLASGVLGPNAPWPFQQNSLSQRIEWDGLTDDFKPALPAGASGGGGCKVKVSLGLQAKYERDIAWAPAKGTYIEKDGKYFRTILPPPAETPAEVLSQLTSKLATTKWGDKVPVGGWFSAFGAAAHQPKMDVAKAAEAKVKPLFAEKAPPRKVEFPPPAVPDGLFGGSPRIFVDPVTDDLYCLTKSGTPGCRVIRYSGKTGQLDTAFNGGGKGNWWNISYLSFGLDGRIYMSCGGMGGSWFLLRVDRNWKGVPFADKSEAHAVKPNPKIRGDVIIEGIPGPMGDRGKGTHDIGPALIADPNSGLNEVLWTGEVDSKNIHDPGFSVSFTGHMLVLVEDVAPEWQAKHKLTYPGRDKALQVWTLEGRLLSSDAIGAACNWGYGVHMDRDGNLYIVAGDTLPKGQDKLDGITDVTQGPRVFGGSGTLMKLRGLGNGKFSTEEGVATVPISMSKNAATVKALWAVGVSGHMGRDCNCAHNLWDLDGFARAWIPARQLCSVVVYDSNGNRVARFGRYGNVDDADPKAGGIHLVTPRGVTASDTSFYVIDSDQNRLLKAALTYAAEETAPVP